MKSLLPGSARRFGVALPSESAPCNKLTRVEILSTDVSECATAIPVLDGQICIDELLTDLGDVLAFAARGQGLPSGGVDGSREQLRLF